MNFHFTEDEQDILTMLHDFAVKEVAPLAAEIDEEISRIIGEAYTRCLAILEENRARLVTVAEYLLAHETMSAADFEAVFTDNAEKME